MLRVLTTLLLLNSFFRALAQEPKNYFPKHILTLDLSEKRNKELERKTVLLYKEKLTTNEEKELDLLLKKHDDLFESVWDITSSECS